MNAIKNVKARINRENVGKAAKVVVNKVIIPIVVLAAATVVVAEFERAIHGEQKVDEPETAEMEVSEEIIAE